MTGSIGVINYELVIPLQFHKYVFKCVYVIDNHLTLSRWNKTCIILLWLTPDDFLRRGESSRSERVTADTFYVTFESSQGHTRMPWEVHHNRHSEISYVMGELYHRPKFFV